MGLSLYFKDNENSILEDGKFLATFDGRAGGVLDKKIYIRNNDIVKWYSNIVLSLDTGTGPNLIDNSINGFYWKLAQQELPLNKEEWKLVSPGNTLNITGNIGSADQGDISTYISIWVRISIPRNQRIEKYKNISFILEAKENRVNV